MNQRRFLIGLNRREGGCACVVCGETWELEVGPALFTPEGGHVCADCGREAAPELAALLGLARAAELYAAVIFESADRPAPPDPEWASRSDIPRAG